MTAGYRADCTTVVKLLNKAFAIEIVCVLRYRRHHFMAVGINTAESLLSRSHAEYVEGEEEHADDLVGLLEEIGKK